MAESMQKARLPGTGKGEGRGARSGGATAFKKMT